jgi:hypothetical protein
MRKTITVVSSHGRFEVDALTGAVTTAIDDMPTPLAEIARVNLAEYRQWCASEGLTPADIIDILLLGIVSMDDQGNERFEDPEWAARSDLLLEIAA